MENVLVTGGAGFIGSNLINKLIEDPNLRVTCLDNFDSFYNPKVKKGGILAGHDYLEITKPTHTHVFEAVNAYTKSYDIKPWFVLGRDDKIPGEIRDKRRSWMWVK